MSWSFSCTGTPKGVAAKIDKELGKSLCQGAEETIRLAIMNAAKAAALDHKGEFGVKVEANGSASSNGDYKTQQFSMKVESLYGFATDPVDNAPKTE